MQPQGSVTWTKSHGTARGGGVPREEQPWQNDHGSGACGEDIRDEGGLPW